MIIPNFISVDASLNCLVITSNIIKNKTIRVQKYLKTDNFSKDFYLILKKNKINLDLANLLLVNLGPGSYAGIRNILSCLKVLSIIKKIKLVGFTNNTMWKIVCKDKHKDCFRIINVNKKFFYLSTNKELKIQQLNKILSKKKVVSNYQYSGIFKKNLISFAYDIKDMKILVNKKLFIEKNINPKY